MNKYFIFHNLLYLSYLHSDLIRYILIGTELNLQFKNIALYYKGKTVGIFITNNSKHIAHKILIFYYRILQNLLCINRT